MATTIEQACVNALKTYLESRLAPYTTPHVTSFKISEEWPAPDAKLPRLAITILKVGERQETHVQPEVVDVQPAMVGAPPAPHAILRDYRWRVKLIQQPLQLDVWSTYPAIRNDIAARIDEALHQGPAVTLNEPSNISLDDFRDGLLLALNPATGHIGHADYQFEGFVIDDTADDVQRNEYRATRTGSVSAALTIVKRMPRMANISIAVSSDGSSSTYNAS